MRNYWILAACMWAFIALVVVVAFTDDPQRTVCIAAQSLDIDGTHIVDATECFEVTP